MSYRLNVESQTYPVEELRLPPAATLAAQPAGETLSFISPIHLPPGKNCALINEAGGFQLEVHGCLGFTFSVKFRVAGVITGQWTPQDPFAPRLDTSQTLA